MSGQPYRYEKDIENFRNEYMEALNLRANIDNMNLQANKNYKETGALPPKSTMKDTRTTAEILMDVEKLKLSIIGDFKDVATPQMMQLVIQRVQNSPLNGDGSFLVWLAQNGPELAGQLRKKYKFGIAGDSNDAESMYLFMQNLFSKTKEMNTSLKSAFDRPVGSDGLGFQVGDFNKLKRAYDDISIRLISSPVVNALKNKIKKQFDAIDNFITVPAPPNNTTRYDQLKQIFRNISSGATMGQQAAINYAGYDKLIEYTEHLPSPAQLRTVLEQIKKSDTNKTDDLTSRLLENLSSLLPDETMSTYMVALSDDIIRTNGVTGGVAPAMPAPVNPTAAAQQQQQLMAGGPPAGAAPAPGGHQGATVLFAEELSDLLSNVVNDVPAPIIAIGAAEPLPNPEVKQYIDNGLRQIDTNLENQFPSWKQMVGYDQKILNDTIVALTGNYSWTYLENNGNPRTFMGNPAGGVRVNFRNRRGPNQNIFIGAGMKRVGRPKGSGIVKPLHERIDTTKGIKQGHTHVPFGKYLINKNRLDEDIMSFKHIKGYGVKGYPSKRISRNLSNILKTIIGGGVPKFNDLSNLSEDEKNYLHTVSNKAGIADKISVPTPSKDSMEQDFHQFEVMKGEILAGNDSSVLIKKFKLLLLKLSKNGSLPKAEATEIMEDLIQLGY